MEKKICKLNDGHIIEAVDRVHVAQDFIESSLRNHALIDAVPEFSSKVEEANKLLSELYQMIGQYDSVKQINETHNI